MSVIAVLHKEEILKRVAKSDKIADIGGDPMVFLMQLSMWMVVSLSLKASLKCRIVCMKPRFHKFITHGQNHRTDEQS